MAPNASLKLTLTDNHATNPNQLCSCDPQAMLREIQTKTSCTMKFVLQILHNCAHTSLQILVKIVPELAFPLGCLVTLKQNYPIGEITAA